MRVENLYVRTGFVNLAFHTIGGQWLGLTSPRPNHSAYTNGVTETSVGHGPTDADDAFLPVRANVTCGPAASYATPITVVVVTAKK